MALATAELFWIRMFLIMFRELHVPLSFPPILWCDNIGQLPWRQTCRSSTLILINTLMIEIDFHFIREKVKNKDIQIRYISTLDQGSRCSAIFSSTWQTECLTHRPSVCGILRCHPQKLAHACRDVEAATEVQMQRMSDNSTSIDLLCCLDQIRGCHIWIIWITYPV